MSQEDRERVPGQDGPSTGRVPVEDTMLGQGRACRGGRRVLRGGCHGSHGGGSAGGGALGANAGQRVLSLHLRGSPAAAGGEVNNRMCFRQRRGQAT